MNKFVKILLLLTAVTVVASSEIKGIKLYFIVSDRNGRSIEKVFLYKSNAEKYVSDFKESHNYDLEEVIVKE